MFQAVLFNLYILIVIQHTLALPALPPLSLIPPVSSALGLGYFASRCRPIHQTVSPVDCFAAINKFSLRKNPGGALHGPVTCTTDETRQGNLGYMVLPDEEVFDSCWVHWSLPYGSDAAVTWVDFFHYSRQLVQECITDDSFGGVSLWGPDREHVVRFGVLPAALRGEEGNRNMTDSVDVL